ncbi:hypothetical protein ENSA7_10300 [Enhygromyxa salina]|uniref:Uncharacterized protein n=1 Tax=Enhygromyxa salina TaxID=215803 RepID=A0A2S9YVD0_9BACT|nr:hypothetical protein ENSA7_10300 [Enhygromyxa salina]
MIQIADATSEILIDVAHAPLYLSCWRGQLSVDVVTQLFEFSHEVAQAALDSMTRVAYVNHVDDVQRPSSDVRRTVTELSLELARSGRREPTVGSWQIICNPLIRGVLTALTWVSSKMVDGRIVSSWEHGITEAVAALEDAGQQLPLGAEIDASRYLFPHPSEQVPRRANGAC